MILQWKFHISQLKQQTWFDIYFIFLQVSDHLHAAGLDVESDLHVPMSLLDIYEHTRVKATYESSVTWCAPV